MRRITAAAVALVVAACGSGGTTLESLSRSFADTSSDPVEVGFTASFGGLQTFSGTGTWDFEIDGGRFTVASPDFAASEIVTIGSDTYRRNADTDEWEQEPAGRLLTESGFLGSWSGSVPGSAVDALGLIDLAEEVTEHEDGAISIITRPTADNDCRVTESKRCVRVEPLSVTVEDGRVISMVVTVLLEVPTDEGVQAEEAIRWSIRYWPLEGSVTLPEDLPEAVRDSSEET